MGGEKIISSIIAYNFLQCRSSSLSFGEGWGEDGRRENNFINYCLQFLISSSSSLSFGEGWGEDGRREKLTSIFTYNFLHCRSSSLSFGEGGGSGRSGQMTLPYNDLQIYYIIAIFPISFRIYKIS